MPWPLAALCALAVGAAASLVVERFTWRWMRDAQEFVPLVSSMAFLILFENLAVAYWGSELQSVPRLFGSADWRDRRSRDQHSAIVRACSARSS